jgi:NMD protein affecting ribosome stability and mRNA decay
MKNIIDIATTKLTNHDEIEQCADCGKEVKLELLIPAPDGSRMLCEDCYYEEVKEQNFYHIEVTN